MSNPHLDVLYCEDYRKEEGGKISLMGLVFNGILLDEIPCQLPNLVTMMRLTYDKSHPIKTSSFIFYLNNKKIASSKEYDLSDQSVKLAVLGNDSESISYSIILDFPFIKVKEEGSLHIKAFTNIGELESAPMRVVLKSVAEARFKSLTHSRSKKVSQPKKTSTTLKSKLPASKTARSIK